MQERSESCVKCPVCGNVNTSMVCLKCGFDSSRNYEKYPTFGPVGKAIPASAKRQEWQEFQQAWQRWQEQQKTVESIPVEPEPQPVVEPVKTVPLVAQTGNPLPPSAEPVKPTRRFPIWLAAAVCTVVVALGIGLGAGLGGRKPDTTEPGGAVQMQEPVETTTVPPETTQQTTPPETTADPALWRNNILRSDEVSDVNGDGFFTSLDAKNTPVLGSNYRRDQICSVTFLDTLSDLPDDAWDVSEAGDGTVMAWVELTEDTELYDLYIGAEGGVSAGESCEDLFMGYENATSIHFGDAFHTENVQDMSSMFSDCSSLTELTLGDRFDTSHVQNMSYMFYCCSSLTELTLGDGFDTSNVQKMSWMFRDCSSLKKLTLGDNFDTSNVQSMVMMFSGCSALTELTLGDGFDTSNVRSMLMMFSDCSALTELTLGDGFVTTNAYTDGMFDRCPAGDEWGHLVN